jgi:hypothetical protein
MFGDTLTDMNSWSVPGTASGGYEMRCQIYGPFKLTFEREAQFR